MPWCEECSKFWTPTSMPANGSCPNCGRRLATPASEARAPWHFKLLVAAVCVYLGWRVVELVQWLF